MRIIDFVSLNSRLESNIEKEERNRTATANDADRERVGVCKSYICQLNLIGAANVELSQPGRFCERIAVDLTGHDRPPG